MLVSCALLLKLVDPHLFHHTINALHIIWLLEKYRKTSRDWTIAHTTYDKDQKVLALLDTTVCGGAHIFQQIFWMREHSV